MKKILVGIGLAVLILAVWQYELVAYGLGQAKGQLKIIWHARPIEEVLQDDQVADSLKQKIRLAQEVREFAIDSIGVNDSDSYRSLYNQHGKPVLWVVTACEPFSMEDKRWSFPILGVFSYKGFFDYNKAKELRAELKLEGYDTGIRTVSAWSTLGILDDPLMSGLLFRSEGELANTIVHELTHATLFVKDSLKFNENLASFVGHRGAEAFLSHKYGKSSEQYAEYVNRQYDSRLFAEAMLKGGRQLEELYDSFTPQMKVKEKKSLKTVTIRKILKEAKSLDYRTKRYTVYLDKLLERKELPNNTFFKGYVRYQAELASLETEFDQHQGDIRSYLSFLKVKYGK